MHVSSFVQPDNLVCHVQNRTHLVVVAIAVARIRCSFNLLSTYLQASLRLSRLSATEWTGSGEVLLERKNDN